jgi:predicted nucleic acid-binding protein
MIVVDSSVWIAHLRNQWEDAAVQRFIAIEDPNDIVVGDVVLLEVLQGARNEKHARLLERWLREFEIVPMLGADQAVRAAQNYRTLRSRGITVRKPNDLIIASFCMERGYRLLHRDRDFLPIAKHLGLKLA